MDGIDQTQSGPSQGIQCQCAWICRLPAGDPALDWLQSHGGEQLLRQVVPTSVVARMQWLISGVSGRGPSAPLQATNEQTADQT